MEGGLNTRQWVLRNWLKMNFVKGRYFTIEEICENVKLYGEPLYTLNKNPRIHDKCLLLSQDVNEINENTIDGYKFIVKDSKGSIKLCESRAEFDEYYERVAQPLYKILKRLNTMKNKTKWDGACPLINKANNPIPTEKVKPVEAFATIGMFDCLDEM